MRRAWKIGEASARAGEAESGASLGMGVGMGGRDEGDVFVWGNFSSGKFGSWKRQAARSESGDGSAFYAFPTNLRLFR